MRTASVYKALRDEDKQFLSAIAKEVAMLADVSNNRNYFQKQLTEFSDKWNAYKTAHEADRKRKWQPSMRKPNNPLETIWPLIYGSSWRDGIKKSFPEKGKIDLRPYHPRKDIKRVLGAYALLAVIHDNILPQCPPIAKDVLPKKLSQEIWRNLITGIDLEAQTFSPGDEVIQRPRCVIRRDLIASFLIDVRADIGQDAPPLSEIEEAYFNKFSPTHRKQWEASRKQWEAEKERQKQQVKNVHAGKKIKTTLEKDADLIRINTYLDDLDKRVEQWGQETTVEAANDTLRYMNNQPHELAKAVRELDEIILKTQEGDTKTILMEELKSRAEIHQQQIGDRVGKINNHITKLTELKSKAVYLQGEMKSIASHIKTSFANTNPRNEVSGEALDEALKRKAEEVEKWAEYIPRDYVNPWGNALDFQIRNSISIRHVLGISFDEILRLLRLHPLYENYNRNKDLAGPLEDKRNDFLSYLDELEGKTKPAPQKPAETEQEKGQVETANTSLADDLDQIANAVHILVQEESNKKCFQKHIAAFRKAKNTFQNALKEAKEAAIANPDLRHDYDEFRDKDKDPPKPPKEGYEVEHHYVLDDHPKGFWRPPLPFNPEGYLQRFQRKLFGLFTREDKPRNQKQKLMCEFGLIAAIRDKGLDIPACDRLTDTEKDDWVDSLWSLLSIEGSTAEDYKNLPGRKRNINTAYVDVLANLPAGKRQEPSGDDAEDTTTREKETSDDFSVNNGQVFYDGKDLRFPSGQIQDFFLKLTDNMGLTVKYEELERITTIEKIRGYKYQASKILKSHSVPYEITSLTNEGYILRSRSE